MCIYTYISTHVCIYIYIYICMITIYIYIYIYVGVQRFRPRCKACSAPDGADPKVYAIRKKTILYIVL